MRATIALALFCIPVLAAAESLSFVIGEDKARIKIPIPDGYCLLDVNKPSDNRVITTFDLQAKGKHKRLAFMVNCQQLTEWRAGDLLTFNDFGYVLLPVEHIGTVSDEPLDVFLNGMGDEIGHNRSNIIRHRGNGYLERYVEQHVVELEHSTTIDLGLIHRDNFALYTASVDKIITETGQEKLTGKVTAITQINGKPLFFYLIRGLEDIQVIAEVEQSLTDWILSAHLGK